MGAVVECLKRYLLAQQVVLPGMLITIITSCLCPLYNWLLIFKWVPAPLGHYSLHAVVLVWDQQYSVAALLDVALQLDAD
jgi:hypothetical protein